MREIKLQIAIRSTHLTWVFGYHESIREESTFELSQSCLLVGVLIFQ